MLLYCFTTTWTEKVYKSTARRYKAHQIGNSKDNDLDAWVMVACYKHEFVKGFWRKQKWSILIYIFYKVYVEDVPIFLNLLTFFLLMKSVVEILDAVEQHEKASYSGLKILEVIHMHEDMREVPYAVGDYRGNARGVDLFNKKHSELVRMRFTGYINHDMYGKVYTYPLSEVNRPANYLGIASRQEHIQNRRGMGLYYSISSLQLLPVKAKYKFLAQEDIS
ncbi:Zinc finger C2H2 [Penicillium malachiteum]|nr:Zinc finger C2H2 [Penicillium malachiteum]